MSEIRAFDQIGPQDLGEVGGKGLSLGLMAGAGLPVPPGFCITTDCHRRLKSHALQSDPLSRHEIIQAYRRLGAGLVAVRSSATAEDGAVASFAGQQETILGVSGESEVLEAISRCWASLDSERAVAYRKRQGVTDDNLAMAVVVQRLVAAEVAGVLFTRDPLDAAGSRMLVEASWGLGESVVSGRVTPDRFHLDRETGKVLDKHVNTKSLQRTPAGWTEVPLEKENQLCLDDHQLTELAALGRRVEAFYGEARDIEWAWAEGQFWLLQARPITTAGAAEREQVRLQEIAALAASAAPKGTVWSRYNLAEILPEPTPMTWAIVRRFMSGKGGFGLMYRDFGFRPEAVLDDIGVYDLVCGRPYCNLSREPGMYANGMPFEHPFAALKAAPQKALYPKAQLNWSRAGWRFWFFFPATMCRSIGLAVRLAGQQRTLAARLREQIFPAFEKETRAEAKVDLERLDSPALFQRLEHWIQRTLCDFARDSLKPTVLAGFLMANLEQMLAKRLGPERASAAVTELTVGARPDADADLAGALCDLSAGRLDRHAFLERFGHRGKQEMELAQPRWSEDPSTLDSLAVHSGRSINAESASSEAALKRVSAEARLQPAQEAALEKELKNLHDFLGLRETAKHHLMRGHALIRRILLELGRRHKLGEGIFYLAPEELSRLIAGEDLAMLIAQRRRRRSLALSLEVPAVLFSDDLQAIGRPQPVEGAGVLQGITLSAGVAEGPALVLSEPVNFDPPSEPYVLVCPSTDPAWVPLFVNARALVMETGGVLSHGAIVAREFGLPAVGGLPGIMRELKSGQRVRVDGTAGVVRMVEAD